MERCRIGRFYQAADGWKTGDNGLTIRWSLVDIVGLLTGRTFLVPDKLPTTLGGWVGAISWAATLLTGTMLTQHIQNFRSRRTVWRR